jgi:hypothetical protein
MWGGGRVRRLGLKVEEAGSADSNLSLLRGKDDDNGDDDSEMKPSQATSFATKDMEGVGCFLVSPFSFRTRPATWPSPIPRPRFSSRHEDSRNEPSFLPHDMIEVIWAFLYNEAFKVSMVLPLMRSDWVRVLNWFPFSFSDSQILQIQTSASVLLHPIQLKASERKGDSRSIWVW